jgi:hypothetical protein
VQTLGSLLTLSEHRACASGVALHNLAAAMLGVSVFMKSPPLKRGENLVDVDNGTISGFSRNDYLR